MTSEQSVSFCRFTAACRPPALGTMAVCLAAVLLASSGASTVSSLTWAFLGWVRSWTASQPRHPVHTGRPVPTVPREPLLPIAVFTCGSLSVRNHKFCSVLRGLSFIPHLMTWCSAVPDGPVRPLQAGPCDSWWLPRAPGASCAASPPPPVSCFSEGPHSPRED